MSVSDLRKFAGLIVVLLFPSSLMATDAALAILHCNGGVWVNGAEVADSTAIFKGDTIETKSGFVANLDSEGSSVLIQGESVVKLEDNHLDLEHGSVAVGTSTAMRVHVKCIRVEPVSKDRTQYDVTDLSGKVEVAAHKDDVNITQGDVARKTSTENDPSKSATVREGQEASREESSACGAPASPEGVGHTLNTKWLEIGGGGGGGAIILCLLLCKGTSTTSVSPSQP
jgi:hypothetical protein